MSHITATLRLLAGLSLVLALLGTTVFAAEAAPAERAPEVLVGFQDDDDDDDGNGATTLPTTGTGSAAPAVAGSFQEDDDDGAGGGATGGRPAHIHAGTCDTLDPNPAFPLTNVAPRGDDDDVEASDSEVEVSLDDLLAQPYAVNIHASDADPTTYVACGELTGSVIDDTLVVGLHQMNGSGLAGVAVLEDDDIDGQTEVTVYLTPCDVVAAPTGAIPAGAGDTGGGDDAGDDD